MSDTSRTALILAGHGSHISPQTAGIIWQYVDALRAAGVADEITAAFWKEMPSFHTVLRTIRADDVTIVPVFMASGYFTQTVIPTETGLTGAVTQRDGRTIRYAAPIGTHPRIRDIVLERVQTTLRETGVQPKDAAIALIGHSTRRNPGSRLTTQAQAEHVRGLYPDAQVEAIFLDDDPEIPLIYEMTDRPVIIAVPYFLAAGSHTTIDVPGELGLERGQMSAQIRGRQVYYTPPPGSGSELIDIIIDTAQQTGAPLNELRHGSAWDCFPQAGRAEFIRAVNERGELCLGELSITPTRIRSRLMRGDSPVTHISTLRDAARHNPARPQGDMLELPGEVNITSPDMLHAVVETIYPGAIAAWAANQRNELNPVSLDETIARQTGMYRALHQLDEPNRQDIMRQMCAGCVRCPVWAKSTPVDDRIPCIEPCNYWLSAALETLQK